MKIAILTQNFYSVFGPSRVVYLQANALARHDNKVTIFTFAGNMRPPEGVSLEILGMPKGSLLSKLFSWTLPLNVVKAFRYAHKLKGYDIIVGHLYPTCWLAYLAKRFYGKRYIYYNHGFLWPLPEKLHLNLIERTYLKGNFLLQKWTAMRADRAISISQYAQWQLKDFARFDSEVIYNAVDMTIFHEEVDGVPIRAKYGLNNMPVLLHVGSIDHRKGIHLLIEAFNLIKQDIPDAKLLIVGKDIYPRYSSLVRQMADESVTFAGEVPNEELPGYYAACEIYVTASLWESFNLPIVEGQACGRPVVAFNLAAHPEVVEAGKTGFLVPTGNVSALAEAVIKLLKDVRLRQEMGQNARNMVKKKFSVDRFSCETCCAIV